LKATAARSGAPASDNRSRLETARAAAVKSSQVNTLPKAKSKTRSKQNKDMHKCSSVYSERGVPLPILTSGGELVGVRACKNATRVPPSLCDVTQTSDPANPPPCACQTRLGDVCSTRPLQTIGPEPLHPNVCGPHVALEEGDQLMLFTIRRRSQVSLFLARVGRTCTLDRRPSKFRAYFLLPRHRTRLMPLSRAAAEQSRKPAEHQRW
jgi:hypothetical protein